MAKLALVRVDGRLIHGATCMIWGSAVSADRIIGIDDVTARNPMLKKITEAVAKNVPCKIMTIDEAVARWKEDQFGEGRVLVIFKTIDAALTARIAGFDFTRLQIGSTLARKDTKRLGDTFFVNQNDINLLTELSEKYSIEIYTQFSPQLQAEPWETSIKAKF